MLDELIAAWSIKIGLISSLLLFFLIGTVLILDAHKVKFNKALIFSLMATMVILPTLFFIGSTLYINTISSSRGPVHWHADFEIWTCGKEQELIDPKGLSNKVGTATLHEHNDKRVHLEGVVVTPPDASIGRFFDVIGGTISNQAVTVPTNEEIKTFVSGKSCPDGSEGVVQVFVYSTENGIYSQRKLENPASYIISPYSQVPNGDCIIVEYGATTETTNRLCRSYKVAESLGKIHLAR